MFKAKVSTAQIAAVIGCSRRTIYREKQRGLCEQLNHRTSKTYMIYSAQKSQNRADQMRDLHKGRPVKLCPQLAAHLEDYIGKRHYSPAAAVREILLQGMALPQISTNTAYRYIYRGYLRLCSLDLPVGRYQLKKKQNEQYIAKNHKNDRSIEERSAEVETREDVGFWEMDTVVGKSAGPSRCLLVLTERKTRNEKIILVPNRRAETTVRALDAIERKLGAEKFGTIYKSITVDNGTEFAMADEIERSCLIDGQRTKVYYCHPYSSWERGSNENVNGMIRRCHPKGTNFANVTQEEIAATENWINNYPRKIHGYKSAATMFRQCLRELGLTA